MPKYSKKSLENLSQCRQELQKIFQEVIKFFDCSILCGHRSKVEQNYMFETGKSKLQWPHSKHNSNPSLAVDVAPYPIDWSKTNRFFYLAGAVDAIARSKGYTIKWGGNWDSDNVFDDQTFNDYCHFELVE